MLDVRSKSYWRCEGRIIVLVYTEQASGSRPRRFDGPRVKAELCTVHLEATPGLNEIQTRGEPPNSKRSISLMDV